MLQLRRKFLDHGRDFLDFSKTSGRDLFEYGNAQSLLNEASKICAVCELIGEEFYILELISDEASKMRVKRVVATRIDYSLQELQLSISSVNNSISGTGKSAVVAQANKLKDDVRQLRGLLETIRTKLPKVEPIKGEKDSAPEPASKQ